ncbi:MAG TPA: flagellar export chaperone FliS [Opitutaceae bacterium]|nr:flagellar export chaperone FliS [Opitutaceae bacterium]
MVAQDCARAYRTNAILTASPGQLVLMLYDGALGALAAAKIAFGRPARDLQRFEVINKQLSKARAIIAELQGRLDYTAHPEFAQTMFRLYEYYNRRLMEANLRKDAEPVAEVERLLGEIRDAWAEMLMKQHMPAAEPVLV